MTILNLFYVLVTIERLWSSLDFYIFYVSSLISKLWIHVICIDKDLVIRTDMETVDGKIQ